MAHKKLEDFSPAKLEALSPPLKVSVFRNMNGRQEVIPLPPRGSNGPGEGYDAAEVQGLSPVITAIAGGGNHLYIVTDVHGTEYRWEWWVDPQNFPPRALSGMQIPTPASLAPVAAPPAAPAQQTALGFAPGPFAAPVAAPTAPPGDWLQAFHANLQRGLVPPPPATPYNGMPGYGGAAAGGMVMPGPGGWPIPIPLAGAPNFPWMTPPYGAPGMPMYPGYPGMPPYYPPPPAQHENSDHDRALKAELENKFQSERSNMQMQAIQKDNEINALKARLDALEKSQHAAPPAPVTASPEYLTMKAELDALKRTSETRASEAATTAAITAALAPLTAKLSVLESAAASRSGDQSQQMMMQAINNNAQAIKDQGNQTVMMFKDLINSQPKALELVAQLQAMTKSTGAQEMLANVNTAYGSVITAIKDAVGFVNSQQPPGPNPIAEGATKAVTALVDIAGRYVEGARQTNEMKATAEIIRAQTAQQGGQPVHQQQLPASNMPPPSAPPVPQVVPLGQPAQPVPAIVVEAAEARKAQPVNGSANGNAQEAAQEEAGGPPMDADEAAEFEVAMFGPSDSQSAEAIRRLRIYVSEKPLPSPVDVVDRIWMGLNHFASQRSKMGIYQYFDRQLWKECIDVLFPQLVNEDGGQERRLALIRTMHRKWSIETGQGDPGPGPTAQPQN